MNGSSRKRPNWTFSITIALVLAASAAVIGSLREVESSDVDRLYLRSTAGPVLFDHGRHQENVGDCVSCHHDLLSAAQAVACGECHDDDMQAEDFDHPELREYHGGECVKCHEQNRDDEEAVSCRSCHLPSSAQKTGFLGCSDCHDDDYTPDMMDHGEYEEIEEHTCDGCHAPESISETYHANCTPCHLESSPQRFGDVDGKAVCGACHLR